MIVRSALATLGVGEQEDAPVFAGENFATEANLITNTQNTDYPRTNLANELTFLEWRNTTLANENITISLGSGAVIGYVGIAKHNLGSTGRTVLIRGDRGGGSGYEDLSTSIIPPNDSPLLFLLPRDNYVSIRVLIGAGSDFIRMAVCKTGDYFRLENKIYVGHNPITLNPKLMFANGRSESGNYLGRYLVGQKTGTMVDADNIRPEFYRGTIEPFLTAAREGTFFFGWRPEKYPHEVAYAWLEDDPAPQNQRPNGMMQASFSLGGIV